MMNVKILFFGLFMFVNQVCTKDQFLVHFIKQYIANEGKPTFLIISHRCWNKNAIVSLGKEISNIGGRTSTSFQTFSKYYYHNLLFVIDLECLPSYEILEWASTNNLFRSPYRWLVLNNGTDQSNPILWNSPVLPDSDVVLATRSENMIHLVEVHKPSPKLGIITTPRGYYNGILVDVRIHRQLFRRRRNVMGHTLTVSNVIQDSNTTRYYLPRDELGKAAHLDTIPKITWMNVKIALEMLNATPAYIFSYRWGYKVNGNWSGMIDDIHSGRADMGTNCLVDNIPRLSVVTWTDNITPYTVRFIFRQPSLSYLANIFSLPFSTGVWLAITVCSVMSSICLYFAAKWEAGEEKASTQLDNLSDTMLLTLSALGQQGCVMEPKKLSGRMIVLVLFTGLMALYAAYSANIVVLLQAPSHSIRTLSNLAKAKITIAALDVDYNKFVFKLHDPRDRVRSTIYKRLEPKKGPKQFYSLNEGVERIRQGLFAFHAITLPVYRRIEETFLESEKCDLVQVDYMTSLAPHIPVRKDSPYIELLRVAFKQLHESGIQSAITKRLVVPKPRCSVSTSSFSSVGLQEMKPVLILMLYGITGSLAILAVEMFVFRLNKRKNRIQTISQNQLENTNEIDTERTSANYDSPL